MSFRKILSIFFLLSFGYALVYSGMHQYSNPAIVIEDCSVVDHHLHKNPDRHSCELCDFLSQIQLDIDEYLWVLVQNETHYAQATQVAPCLDHYNLPAVRGPPIS